MLRGSDSWRLVLTKKGQLIPFSGRSIEPDQLNGRRWDRKVERIREFVGFGLDWRTIRFTAWAGLRLSVASPGPITGGFRVRVGDVRALGSPLEVHGMGGVSTRADSTEQEG